MQTRHNVADRQSSTARHLVHASANDACHNRPTSARAWIRGPESVGLRAPAGLSRLGRGRL